jgi:peptidoglycan/LPS O-acetylase OafA/YrhL
MEKSSLRSLLRAMLVWTVTAISLCFLSACVIRAHGVSSAAFGYVSSAISFLCALLAAAVGADGERRIVSGLLCGAGLSLILLTAGYLIGGKEMDPSGILSVLSFTFAGCLTGSILFGGRKAETKRRDFKRKKKQNGKS